MSVAPSVQSKLEKQEERLRILRETHPTKDRRDVISTSSRTKLDRLATFLFKAAQLARDSKMKLVIFGYDPNDTQGSCKQYCFAPNQEELVAQEFHKKWVNDWETYCENLEVSRQAEVPETSNSVQAIIDMVAATEMDSTTGSGASTSRGDSRADSGIGTNEMDSTSDSTEGAPTIKIDSILDSGLSEDSGPVTNEMDFAESYSDMEKFLTTLPAPSAPKSRRLTPSKADEDMFLVRSGATLSKDTPAKSSKRASRQSDVPTLVDKEAAVITSRNSSVTTTIPSNASKQDIQTIVFLQPSSSGSKKENVAKSSNLPSQALATPSLVQKGAVVNTSRNSESHAIKRCMQTAANETSMHSVKASKNKNKSSNNATISLTTTVVDNGASVVSTPPNLTSGVGHVGILPSIAFTRVDKNTAARTRPLVKPVRITTASQSMSVGVRTTEPTGINTKGDSSSSQSALTTNFVVSPRNNFDESNGMVAGAGIDIRTATPVCGALASSPFVKTSTGHNPVIKLSSAQVRKLLVSNPELKSVLGHIVGPLPGL